MIPLASGTCGESATWEIFGNTLYIRGTGAMTDFANYTSAVPWYGNWSKIDRIEIEDGISHIGNNSFRCISSLRFGVSIPDSVVSIGSYAFYDLDNLTEIDLPPNLESIGEYAFYGCSDLTEVVIPEGVTAIPQYAFQNLSGCERFIIPDSVTSIGQYGVTGPKYIQVGRGVTELANYALYYSGSAVIEFMGEQPATIGTNPVYNSSSYYIAVVTPGWDATVLGTAVYALTHSCGETATWEMDLDSMTITVSGTGAIDFAKSTTSTSGYCKLHPFFKSGLINRIVIGEGITEIASYSFMRAEFFEIDLPSTLTKLGSYVFNLTHLTYMVFRSEAAPTCSTKAFALYEQRMLVDTPGWSPRTVFVNYGNFAVSDSTDEFANHVRVTYNHLCGASIIYAIDNVTRNITLEGSGETYNYAYSSSGAADTRPFATIGPKKVTVGEGITGLGSQLFRGSSIRKLILPSTIQSIGQYCFHGQSNLAPIEFPEGLYELGNYAFGNCDMRHVILPSTLTTLGTGVFSTDSMVSGEFYTAVARGNVTLATSLFYTYSTLPTDAKIKLLYGERATAVNSGMSALKGEIYMRVAGGWVYIKSMYADNNQA